MKHDSGKELDIQYSDSGKKEDMHDFRLGQKGRHFFLLCCFFLSGMSGLAQEVVWTRLLTLVFGGTSLAITTLLTTFMSGLACGSYLGGKWAKKTSNPLRMYAYLEGFIGVWGLALPVLFQYLPNFYQTIASGVDGPSLIWIRFLLTFCLLLPPTIAMGATLPFVAEVLARWKRQISFQTSLFYTCNTFGAVLGCFGSGFFLLPWLGLKATVFFFAAFNLVICFLLLFVRSEDVRIKRRQEELQEIIEVASNHRNQRHYHIGFLSFLAIALGILSMAAQICWTRVFAYILGSSVYSFSLILTTFLLGFGSGSSFATWYIRRRENSRGILHLACFLIAICLWTGTFFMDELPVFFFYMAKQIQLSPWWIFGAKSLSIAMFVFLPTVGMGMFFPLLLKEAQQEESETTSITGTLYANHTIGAIFGSFFTGFFLFSWLGVQNILLLLVVAYVFFGLLLFLSSNNRYSGKNNIFLSAFVLVLSVVVLWKTPSWNRERLTLGLFRMSILLQVPKGHRFKAIPVIYHKDGRSATVTVVKQGKEIALKVNGKTDASNGGDMPTQVLSGILPLVFHGAPKKVAVIGWGSGVTVGSVLDFGVPTVTAVEIEPAVIEGAKFFGPDNGYAWKNPRLKLVLDDGRNFLATMQDKVDVLISEPSNPWMSGVSSLFTVEFFQLAYKRLKSDGILCQWVQFYELSPENIRALLHSVQKVFPYVMVFTPLKGGNDNLVIASKKPIALKRKQLQKWFDKQPIRRAFSRAGVFSPMDILPRLVGTSADVKKLTRGAKLNTDDNALLEFSAPIELLTFAQQDGGDVIRQKIHLTKETYARFFSDASLVNASFWSELALSFLRFGEEKRSLQFANIAKKMEPANPTLKLYQKVLRLLSFGDFLFHKRYPIKRTKENQTLLKTCWSPFSQLIIERNDTLKNEDRNQKQLATLIRGVWAFRNGNPKKARLLLRPLEKESLLIRTYPGLAFLFSRLYKQEKQWAKAVFYAVKYVKSRPKEEKRCVFAED